jgi:hypothetical protein
MIWIVAFLSALVLALMVIIAILYWRAYGRSLASPANDAELGEQPSHRDPGPYHTGASSLADTSGMAESKRNVVETARGASADSSFINDDDEFEEIALTGSSDNIRTAHAVPIVQVQRASFSPKAHKQFRI